MNKHSRLLQTFVNYGCKKFYNIGPRSSYSSKLFVFFFTLDVGWTNCSL